MKTISIIGAGAVGRSIALALFYSGVTIAGVYSKNGRTATALAKKVCAQKFGSMSNFEFLSDVVIIAVPDDMISDVAKALAKKSRSLKGKIIFHTSGALTSDELLSLKRKGASVASFHPLQTFSPSKQQTSLKDVWCAVEGDAKAITIARAIGRKLRVNVFTILKKDKTLYHASAVFASNYLVTLLSVVEEIARTINIPEKNIWNIYSSLIVQTLQNVFSSSPKFALTGPIARGDVRTVVKHIKALSKPTLNHLVALYSALGIETTRLVKKKHAG